MPLLDEAAELLGSDGDRAGGGRAERASWSTPGEVLRGLAGRRDGQRRAAGRALGRPSRCGRSVAEHATGDREWTYGHVVVDEAQELSPMAWRVLMRRCPTRSMTIVGDLAQTGALGGVSSWASTFRPYVAERATIETLTVNYRTPAQLMSLATRGAAGRRSAGDRADLGPHHVVGPVFTRGPGRASPRSAAIVRDELDLVGAGTLGVLCPARPARRRCAAAVRSPTGPARVAVLTVEQAKGLEFDGVAAAGAGRDRAPTHRAALNDLYVAITRPTQRLHVLHADPLPPGFEEA